MTAFDAATREIVKSRSGGRCELCGSRLEVAHFHHRRPRGMGGSRSNATGAASNCLVLHSGCHADIESNRQRALDNGWLVSQWKDPATIPVKRWDGLFLLADDGTVSPA